MRSYALFFLAMTLQIALQSMHPECVRAQQEPSARPAQYNVGGGYYMAGNYGATALSADIMAEAAFIESLGKYNESTAFARRHNSIAAKQEMANAVDWVSKYFERRRLNREFRALEHPNFEARERKLQGTYRRLLTEDFQTALRTDPTPLMNWALHELFGLSMPYQFLAGVNGSIVDSDSDRKLHPDDIHHIRFIEAGPAKGKGLVFRADSEELLETRWPWVLKGPEFASFCNRFETVRKEVIEEIKSQREFPYASQQELMSTVDDLRLAFNAAYPTEKRAQSANTNARYLAGERFLESLACNVYRLIVTDDPRVFNGSYRFEGDSVADLIYHMYQYSLEFAPPAEGDEGVYQQLFYDIRKIYLQLSPVSRNSPSKP